MTAAWATLPETHVARGTDPQNFFRNAGHLFALRRFRAYTFTLGFTSCVFFAFLGGAPHIMMDVLKRTPMEYGLWFLTISVAYMAGNFLSGRYTIKFGIDRMIMVGCAVTVGGGFLPRRRRHRLPFARHIVHPDVARCLRQWPHHSQRHGGAISVDSHDRCCRRLVRLHPDGLRLRRLAIGGVTANRLAPRGFLVHGRCQHAGLAHPLARARRS